MGVLGQIAVFSWTKYIGSIALAAFIGGILGFVMSVVVELLIGRRVSDRIKGGLVFIGVVVGYATVKAFLDRE